MARTVGRPDRTVTRRLQALIRSRPAAGACSRTTRQILQKTPRRCQFPIGSWRDDLIYILTVPHVIHGKPAPVGGGSEEFAPGGEAPPVTSVARWMPRSWRRGGGEAGGVALLAHHDHLEVVRRDRETRIRSGVEAPLQDVALDDQGAGQPALGGPLGLRPDIHHDCTGPRWIWACAGVSLKRRPRANSSTCWMVLRPVLAVVAGGLRTLTNSVRPAGNFSNVTVLLAFRTHASQPVTAHRRADRPRAPGID